MRDPSKDQDAGEIEVVDSIVAILAGEDESCGLQSLFADVDHSPRAHAGASSPSSPFQNRHGRDKRWDGGRKNMPAYNAAQGTNFCQPAARTGYRAVVTKRGQN